jgi:hypothetical protein
MKEKLALAINRFKDQSKLFTEKLDKVSESIRSIEADFTINIPFKLFLENYDGSVYFSWEKDELSKVFRLFLIKQDDAGNEIQKDPFINTDFKTRMEYFEYLPFFINEFTDHIEKISAQL